MYIFKAIFMVLILALSGVGFADVPDEPNPEASTEAGFSGGENCCVKHSKNGILSERSDADTMVVVGSVMDKDKTPKELGSSKANR